MLYDLLHIVIYYNWITLITVSTLITQIIVKLFLKL